MKISLRQSKPISKRTMESLTKEMYDWLEERFSTPMDGIVFLAYMRDTMEKTYNMYCVKDDGDLPELEEDERWE